MRWLALTSLIGVGLFAAGNVAVKQAAHGPQSEDGVEVQVRKLAPPEPEAGRVEGGERGVNDPMSDFDLYMRSVGEAGHALERVAGYTATLEQQVEIDGTLREPGTIDVKIRHEPFSVYMKWHLDGQEVLYVDGKNDGRLLARPTRGIFALRGLWKLPPESKQAMKDCRYPVTELGIKRLQERIEEFHRDRGYSPRGLECRHYVDTGEGRTYLRFDTTFESPQEGREYSRSIVTIDAATMFTVGVENYGWTPEGEPGDLMERYLYRNVTVIENPSDDDFDERNPEYKFSALGR